MKTRYLSGIMLLALGLTTFTACDDDEDYTISTTPVLQAQSVVTGNAEVTAVSANLTGSIAGLEKMSSSSYTSGFYFIEGNGDPKSGTRIVSGLNEGTLNASATGLATNVTYTYCAFVTLQGHVSYYGENKTFTTTSAILNTQDAQSVTGARAFLGAGVDGLNGVSTEVGSGVKLLTVADAEAIKTAGVDYPFSAVSGSNIGQEVTGLLPNTTYYYMPYINLGSGYVYGAMKDFTTAPVQFEYVDLGLSMKWATFNVGAESESEQGGIYTYEQGKDVAMQIGAGHTPTLTDIKELVNTCSYEWTSVNGTPGARFTAPNGNSIFVPAAAGYWSAEQSMYETHAQSFSVNGSSANISAELVESMFAVRPVRKNDAKLNAADLVNTWYIDLNAAGVSFRFDGPLYYYGTDDCWTSCSDGEPVSGDSWNWCPDWKGNSWLCPAQDYGTMTFTADGKVMVNDLGNGVTAEGTYTVDAEHKTLTLTGAKILHLPNFSDIVTNWSTELKIMSLTAETLQIGALRDNSSEGLCLLVHNYVPESVANSLAPLRPLLNTTWYVDLDAEGKCYVSDGPVYFYGPVGGYSWTEIHDGMEATAEGAWSWIPVWNDNQWICAAQNFGEMTFTADGKVTVKDLRHATEKSGTYTVDITNHTITLEGVEVLYVDDNVANLSNQIKILDLSENHLMLGLDRGDDTLLGINYVKAAYWQSFQPGNYEVNFMTCDTNWNWLDHKQNMAIEAGHTYTITAAGAQTNGMIDCIDFEGLCAEHPNTIIRVDEVKVDGNAIAFDANLMGHGDVEGKGNYRIEFFNTYGKTGELGNDAFGAGITEAGGNKGANALACNDQIEVTFTVVTLDGFTAGLTVCDSNWNSSWPDASTSIALNNVFPLEYTITYEGARADGMIDLVEIQDIVASLPNTQLTLKSVKVDGAELPFDNSKINYGDLEGKGHYRIELYNTYGASKDNAAFEGETDGKIPALGFEQSIEVTFSLDKLF